MPATRGHRTKKQNEFSCQYPDCGKTFSRTYDLQRHERIHCDYDSRRFGCKVEGCSFRANQLAGLKVHENSIHRGIRLPCDFPGCDRTFSDPSSRSKHRQRFHNQAPDSEQSAEPEAQEPAPRLEEVPQGVPRYSPEAAIPPVPQYFPMPNRSTNHGSHGVTVPARVVRHVEANSGVEAQDVLSQFASFALATASSSSSAPLPPGDDSDSASGSSTSTSSRRSRRSKPTYRGISRGASSAASSSSAVPSTIDSSAASPASTSSSSRSTPTHVPSPPSELSGVLPLACNVATDISNVQPTYMGTQDNCEVAAYNPPQLNVYAEPNRSQSWTTLPSIPVAEDCAPYHGVYLSPNSSDNGPSIQYQQMAHTSQEQPLIKQDEWIQSYGTLQVEVMNFNNATMAYDNQAQLYPSDFRSTYSAIPAYPEATSNTFFEVSTIDFQNPQLFDQLAVQTFDIEKALESVQPKSPTPGNSTFLSMVGSHSSWDTHGMQDFFI